MGYEGSSSEGISSAGSSGFLEAILKKEDEIEAEQGYDVEYSAALHFSTNVQPTEEVIDGLLAELNG